MKVQFSLLVEQDDVEKEYNGFFWRKDGFIMAIKEVQNMESYAPKIGRGQRRIRLWSGDNQSKKIFKIFISNIYFYLMCPYADSVFKLQCPSVVLCHPTSRGFNKNAVLSKIV